MSDWSTIKMSDKYGVSDTPKVRLIPLSYVNAESQSSALRLILTLCPDWENSQGSVEFERFTDGITNTVRFSPPFTPGSSWLNEDPCTASEGCQPTPWLNGRAN